MGLPCDNLDLGALELGAGESRSLELGLDVGSFKSGGLSYSTTPGEIATKLSVSKTISGWALRLTFQTGVLGPCSRCLKDAVEQIEVDAREVDQPCEDEELSSPYVDSGHLDIRSWVQDALVLALPPKLLCSEGCRGLCSVCGADLNTCDPLEHRHAGDYDPRWAKLKEYKGPE